MTVVAVIVVMTVVVGVMSMAVVMPLMSMVVLLMAVVMPLMSMVVLLMAVVMVCMPVIVVIVVIVGVLVMGVFALLLGLLFNDLVGFEQAHAQQQWQRHIPFDRMQKASIGFDFTEHPFQLLEAFWWDQISFVEHQDVAIEHLSSADLGIEDLFSKVLGVDQRDDRIEACFIA